VVDAIPLVGHDVEGGLTAFGDFVYVEPELVDVEAESVFNALTGRLRCGPEFKILNTVIVSMTVLVVHVLAALELSPKVLLHDVAMLALCFAFKSPRYVSMFSYVPCSSGVASTGVSTIKIVPTPTITAVVKTTFTLGFGFTVTPFSGAYSAVVNDD
jgi:hypothetical protein